MLSGKWIVDEQEKSKEARQEAGVVFWTKDDGSFN